MDKRCNKCGEVRALDDFYRSSAGMDGRRPECKSCNSAIRKANYSRTREKNIARAKAWPQANPERHRENQRKRRQRPEVKARERDAHLRRTFGITLEQYDEMLDAQGGVCAICGREPSEGISLHVDHDHVTGSNRKLLCFRCNNALGDLDDDPALLRTAAAYLDDHDPEAHELAELTRRRLAGLRG